MNAKREVQKESRDRAKSSSIALRRSAPCSLNRAMDCALEKGATSWLTALPLEEFNLTLHKGAFRDAIALRYGWQPINVPSKCACGQSFTVEHALSFPMGGFPTIRHNEIRDLTANLMSEVCHDVCVEPSLQPVTGEILNGAFAITEDGARLTSPLMVFGEAGTSGRTSTCVFSILSLLQTDNRWLPATESTRILRRGPMSRECVRSNMVLSLYLCCLLLEGLAKRQICATRGLPK